MVTLTISYIIYPVEKCVISTVPSLISNIQIRLELNIKKKSSHPTVFKFDNEQHSLFPVYKKATFLSKLLIVINILVAERGKK